MFVVTHFTMNMDTISFLEHQTSYYNTMSLPKHKKQVSNITVLIISFLMHKITGNSLSEFLFQKTTFQS